MKVIIEQEDIEGIKTVACDYYGVILNDFQVRNLLDNDGLKAEIFEFGVFDTCVREFIADAIVEFVLEDVPCEIHEWHWPTYGDSEEYKENFDKLFKENAKKKGYELT